ncbi:dUTP diphosphatase [Brevibacillus choshinensis]|uniref:dUTP diphosphatase n=1 Tax=Brevibacillus choshinensis TaxID=54911 RepID=UPI0006EC1EB7
MNLKAFFEKQRQLDKYIIKKKGLEGQDLLQNKILALQVELGELANEWRGFKHWSDNQEPRTVAERGSCEMCVVSNVPRRRRTNL